MKVTVNGIDFESQKELRNYVRGVLLQNEEEKITPMDDDYQFLDELMDRHPNRSTKIKGDIQFFRVIRNMNQALAINICDDEGEKDVSWSSCINSKAKTPINLLTAAMRSSVMEQTQGYKRSFFWVGDKCKNCDKEIHEMRMAHVDHDPISFAEIKEKFLSTAKDIPTTFTKTDRHSPPQFTVKDNQFKWSWQHHHELEATYQILCASCNLRKKKSKI